MIVIAICLLAIVFYRPILTRLGFGRYFGQPRPPATAPPRDTTASPPVSAAPEVRPAAPRGPAPAPALAAEAAPAAAIERRIHIETPLYDAEFSSAGARLLSIELKRFATARNAHGPRPSPGAEVPVAERVRLAGAPTFQLDLGSGANRRPLGGLAYAVSESLDAGHAVRALTFTGRDPSGVQVRQTYRARPDSYAMDLEVEITDVPASLPFTDYSLTVRSWPALTEADHRSDQRAMLASSLVGTNLHRDQVGGLLKGPKSFDGNVAWAGVQSRYFVAVAALVQGAARGVSATGEERPLPPGALVNPGPRDRLVQDVAINTMFVSLPSAERPVHRFVLYAGPAELAALGKLPGTQLDRMVYLGYNWIRPISALLLRLLNMIEVVLRNYGVAIIVLATVLRLLLHPLNMASMKSMRAMQRLQPRIDALRAKHKTDAQALNAAIMALYAEEKVNPAGGCLPMLIQMPVLIALYQVLFNAIELRQAPFMGWINDLSAPDVLFTLGFFPVRLLPLLMAGSGLLLQRMTPTSPQQAPTAYLMNLFMLYIFYNMPSGLVLYWTVMNVLSALQQWLVLRQDDQPGAAPATGAARKRAPAGA